MALPPVHVFVPGETLTAANLNGMNNNILQNPIQLISPLTGDVDANNNDLLNVKSTQYQTQSADPAAAGEMLLRGNLLKHYDGTAVRANQVIHLAGQSVNFHTVAVEVPFWVSTIPGGALGTNGQFQLDLATEIALTAQSFVYLKCYYAGILGSTVAIVNETQVDSTQTFCPLTLVVAGAGATNSQWTDLRMHTCRAQSDQANPFGSVIPLVGHTATVAVDSTVTQQIQLNILFSLGDPGNAIHYLYAIGKIMG